MKNNFPANSFLIALMTIAIISCKKQNLTESQAGSLENTTWLLTKEILFFPTGKVETSTRNSVWYFLDDHKLKIFNPDSFIQEEKGGWSATADKINIDINNDDLWRYKRNFKIISKTDLYMRLNVEDLVVETSDYGKTSEVHYVLVKI